MQLSLVIGQAMLLSSACAAPMDHTGSGKFLGPRRVPLYAGSNALFPNETLAKRQLPLYTSTSMATQMTFPEKRRLPQYPGPSLNGSQTPAQKRDGQAQLLTKRRAAEYPGSRLYEENVKEDLHEGRKPFWPNRHEDNKKEWQYEEKGCCGENEYGKQRYEKDNYHKEKGYEEAAPKETKYEELDDYWNKGQGTYWKNGHEKGDSYKENDYKEKETFQQESRKEQERFKEKNHADKKEDHDYCGCDCKEPNPKYIPQLPKNFWNFEYDHGEKW